MRCAKVRCIFNTLKLIVCISMLYKYPRTPHLPWSPGVTDDDIRVQKLSAFDGREVIVTEKMDGENTTLYCNHIHARSLDSKHHSSRDWVKQWHSSFAHNIPDNWRICGENLFARHSVNYEKLASYFYGFSLWNDHNICCSWADTLEWFEILGIVPVTILYKGIWNEQTIRDLNVDTTISEGYVVRTSGPYAYADFKVNNAKWVRQNHVQTEKHWMHKKVVPNGLKEFE